MKLAEALLRRKELEAKVRQLHDIDAKALYEVKAKRVNVTENLDDVTAMVPKLKASQVTEEYDFYARQLRKIDAAIQQMNWTVDVTGVGDEVMMTYKP